MASNGLHRHWLMKTEPWGYVSDRPITTSLDRVRAAAARAASSYLWDRYRDQHPSYELVYSQFFSRALGAIDHREPYVDGMMLKITGLTRIGINISPLRGGDLSRRIAILRWSIFVVLGARQGLLAI